MFYSITETLQVLQHRRKPKDYPQLPEDRRQPAALRQQWTEPQGQQEPSVATSPEVVARRDSVGRVLVVKASEGVLWHTVGSSSVQVAVPVDLQRHDSALPSGGEEVSSPSVRSARH